MSNARTEEFLELYKRLEAVAEGYGRKYGGRGASPVLRLASLPRFAYMKNDLDYCREVRNLLQHEVRINGDFAVYPSDKMLDFLKNTVHTLEYPMRAIERATAREELLLALPGDPVLPLMQKMQERALSHVPVMEGDAVIGVFSENTVFQACIDGRSVPLNGETKVSAFGGYLPISMHLGHRFSFIPEDTLLDDAREIFDREYGRENKLRALFLTKTGRPAEPLLALMTPYDVLELPKRR